MFEWGLVLIDDVVMSRHLGDTGMLEVFNQLARGLADSPR
jgi:hypothetical protein